jgi:hypothetical protein
MQITVIYAASFLSGLDKLCMQMVLDRGHLFFPIWYFHLFTHVLILQANFLFHCGQIIMLLASFIQPELYGSFPVPYWTWLVIWLGTITCWQSGTLFPIWWLISICSAFTFAFQNVKHLNCFRQAIYSVTSVRKLYNQVTHVLVVWNVTESGFWLALFVDLYCKSQNICRIPHDRSFRGVYFVITGLWTWVNWKELLAKSTGSCSYLLITCLCPSAWAACVSPPPFFGSLHSSL